MLSAPWVGNFVKNFRNNFKKLKNIIKIDEKFIKILISRNLLFSKQGVEHLHY